MKTEKMIRQAALLADMESRLQSLERNEVPEGIEDYAEGVRRGFRLGMSYVRSCEAVDAFEVVHSQWRTDVAAAECMNCEAIFPGFLRFHEWCPNCGAKMDDVYQPPICGPGEDDDT